jgi:hypothetical protein
VFFCALTVGHLGSTGNFVALTVTERNERQELYTPETTDDDPRYAIWFYLDRDQSAFVEMHATAPTRQPEFFVRDSHHLLLVELFRSKPKSEERVLIGEAEIPISFLVSTMDNHLIVELLRAGNIIAATLLIRVEKLDSKGRSIRPSPCPSLCTTISEEIQITPTYNLDHSSSAGTFLFWINV